MIGPNDVRFGKIITTDIITMLLKKMMVYDPIFLSRFYKDLYKGYKDKIMSTETSYVLNIEPPPTKKVMVDIYSSDICDLASFVISSFYRLDHYEDSLRLGLRDAVVCFALMFGIKKEIVFNEIISQNLKAIISSKIESKESFLNLEKIMKYADEESVEEIIYNINAINYKTLEHK